VIDVRIVSIGALAAHPLRGEKTPVRTGHATTTLLRAGSKRILVDPGLPAQALVQRLDERAGLKPAEITHVFLTGFNPETRRGLPAFENATWWVSQDERESIGTALVAKLHEAAEEEDAKLRELLELDVALLRRCEPAPDHLADEKGERVDLFPLAGVTPGLCGLIIAGQRHSTVIAGDAIPTIEHLEQGKVLPVVHDLDKARESFAEAVEIADIIVPGRDNLTINPTKRLF
jgi:glyoxylase-like metal-dependent hydrolase (beta-lactamase superfamily II)